jgi:hypothetical protein
VSPWWRWWIAIAGTLLVVGGIAWILKLWVIVATDGRVVATGAAGAFFDLGLYSLLVGSTGLGVRLAISQEPAMRGVAAAASPVVFILLFSAFSGVGYAILAIVGAVAGVALPSYLLEEAGIFLSAVVWLVIGLVLLFGVLRNHTWQPPPKRSSPPRH